MKKLLLPSIFLALAGFGCGSDEGDTTPVRAETVTIGDESDVIALGDESPTSYGEPIAYARSECSLNEVQFPAGESSLDEAGYERLHELSVCLKAGEIAQVHVVGMDDPETDADREHALAERRAMLVVDYLLDEGLDEPDVRYEDRQDIEGFVLTWPEAVVAGTSRPRG